MTAEDMLNEKDLIYYMGNGEDEVEGSLQCVLEVIQKVAELAFDAGHSRGYVQGIINYDPFMPQNNTRPNKEQFIKELFQPI